MIVKQRIYTCGDACNELTTRENGEKLITKILNKIDSNIYRPNEILYDDFFGKNSSTKLYDKEWASSIPHPIRVTEVDGKRTIFTKHIFLCSLFGFEIDKYVE